VALDFPNTPVTGQLFPAPPTPGVPVWRWDGTEWVPQSVAQSSIAINAKVTVFTASGTYTPTSGMLYCIIECQGGGGGSGGVAGTAATNTFNGSGGGGGGTYSRRTCTAAQIGASQAVTVGAGGPAGASGANAGQAGGQSSVGSLVNAPGGNGSNGVNGVGSYGQGGTGGNIGVGDFSMIGQTGSPSFYNNGAGGSVSVASNKGGNSILGSGGQTTTPGVGATSVGANGLGYGGGAGGACFAAVAANAPGGTGAPGVVIITEFGNWTATSTNVVRSELAGLVMSTAGASTTFAVAPGAAADSTNTDWLTLGQSISKTQAAWAAGSGVGGLDTGTIAATNTWYHVFVIKNPTTAVVDVLFSLSPSAPTLPSGFTLFRRIGSIRVGGVGNWQGFVQLGDEFLWTAYTADYTTVAWSTAAALQPLTVPTGVQVNALFSGRSDAASGSGAILFSSPDVTDQSPSNAISSLAVLSATSSISTGNFSIRTDTSGRIRVRANATGPSYSIATIGWIDRRGRDA
jgi:hypothetical protein